MSYADFEAAITSTRLRAVAQHWAKAKGTRKIAAWTDINPSAISEHLAIVFSYSYDSSEDQFFGRLAGNSISGISLVNFKGASMEEVRPPKQYPHAFNRAKRVITEPAFYRGIGQVYTTGEQSMLGERIVLPLAADGVHPDGIFGAADYQSVANYHPGARDASEVEHWFAL